jgi:hypothetical protein
MQVEIRHAHTRRSVRQHRELVELGHAMSSGYIPQTLRDFACLPPIGD